LDSTEPSVREKSSIPQCFGMEKSECISRRRAGHCISDSVKETGLRRTANTRILSLKWIHTKYENSYCIVWILSEF